MENLKINGFLKSPSNTIIVGSSGSGKTTLVLDLIRHKEYIFDHPINKIYFCYSMEQDIYKEMRDMGVIFYQGVPSEETLMSWSDSVNHNIVIYDDLSDSLISNKTNLSTITNAFCCLSHHRKVNYIILLHNLFFKEFRTLSLNTHNIFLMRQVRDKSTLISLSKQMFPGKSQAFLKVYNDAMLESSQYTAKPAYILVKAGAFDSQYQLFTSIFPNNQHCLYIIE